MEERRFRTWLHHIPVMAFSGKMIPYEEAFSTSQQKQNSRMTEGGQGENPQTCGGYIKSI
ncbi:hypothetical protein BC1_00072 [Bacillus phage BC-1]|nr:hypothetical protein BC1_00072 [Bacillus phage BC-1]